MTISGLIRFGVAAAIATTLLASAPTAYAQSTQPNVTAPIVKEGVKSSIDAEKKSIAAERKRLEEEAKKKAASGK